MIIVLKTGIGNEQVDSLKNWLTEKGLSISPIYGAEKTVLGLVGDTSHLSIDEVSMHEAVEKVLKVQEPYKKANRKFHPENTVIKVGNVSVGAKDLIVIAGPCSVESEEQIMQIARQVKNYGAGMLRRGTVCEKLRSVFFCGDGEAHCVLCHCNGRIANQTVKAQARNMQDIGRGKIDLVVFAE